MNEDITGLLDVISGQTPIKVEINLSMQSIITIIVAIVVANILSNLLIK